MLDVFMRLDFCECHFSPSSKCRKCWRKMTSVPSCNCDLAAFTHGLSVCAMFFILCDNWTSVTYPWTRQYDSLSVVSHTCISCVSALLRSWVLCGSFSPD